MEKKEKVVTGEWMAKLEKGELNEESAKIGLGLFAFENMLSLISDEGMFAIEAAKDVAIQDLEKKYQAKFIRGELKEDVMYCLMKRWGDLNIEVSVWNCQASVIFRADDGKPVGFECDEETEKKLAELAYDSVYDAGGAINWSGLYPPNPQLIHFFRESISKGKIQKIEEEVK
jgi:hypothetical protein